MTADTTGFLASSLHGWASDGTCDPSEMVDNISCVLCALSWEKGPELRNFHDFLQNEEQLTWHRATCVLTSRSVDDPLGELRDQGKHSQHLHIIGDFIQGHEMLHFSPNTQELG